MKNDQSAKRRVAGRPGVKKKKAPATDKQSVMLELRKISENPTLTDAVREQAAAKLKKLRS